MTSLPPRVVRFRYRDPLDAIWRAAARRIGFEVTRSPDVFASTDGSRRLSIGTPETLDPDDSLAQMVLHELCHALVEGPAALDREDWGLDNRSDRDVPRERACLRLQAALTGDHGLRGFLAPTTDHRAFYDALPTDPLTAGPTDEVTPARAARARVDLPPFAPHLAAALRATARIVEAVRAAGGGEDGDADLYHA